MIFIRFIDIGVDLVMDELPKMGNFFSPCPEWLFRLQIDACFFIAVVHDMQLRCAIKECKMFSQPDGMKNEADIDISNPRANDVFEQ